MVGVQEGEAVDLLGLFVIGLVLMVGVAVITLTVGATLGLDVESVNVVGVNVGVRVGLRVGLSGTLKSAISKLGVQS